MALSQLLDENSEKNQSGIDLKFYASKLLNRANLTNDWLHSQS
jgi:hypothetical protein